MPWGDSFLPVYIINISVRIAVTPLLGRPTVAITLYRLGLLTQVQIHAMETFAKETLKLVNWLCMF